MKYKKQKEKNIHYKCYLQEVFPCKTQFKRVGGFSQWITKKFKTVRIPSWFCFYSLEQNLVWWHTLFSISLYIWQFIKSSNHKHYHIKAIVYFVYNLKKCRCRLSYAKMSWVENQLNLSPVVFLLIKNAAETINDISVRGMTTCLKLFDLSRQGHMTAWWKSCFFLWEKNCIFRIFIKNIKYNKVT